MGNFAPDQPIENVDDDKLNWGRYAGMLANGIKNADVSKASVVIGLQGDWGSGKSSLKNLAVQRLRLEGWQDKQILEFDPWLIQGSAQIAERFFLELAKKVGNVTNKDAADIKKDLLQNARLTGAVKGLMNWGPLILKMYGKLAGDEATAQTAENIDAFSKATTPVITSTEELYKSLAESIEDEKTDLDTVRKRLMQRFKDLDSRILIVVDDLDRLTPEEIRIMFQLVKANCTFPNILFLLLFQKDIVEESLGTSHSENPNFGRNFLEKIVQCPLNVPTLPGRQLQGFFRKTLDEIITSHQLSADIVPPNDLNVAVPLLSPYFRTLRQVNRFAQSYSFYLGLFVEEGGTVINPIDLLLLEGLRFVEPEVHALLPKCTAWLMSGANTNERTALFKPLKGDYDRNGLLERIIFNLFPGTATAAHNTFTPATEEDKRLARVRLPENLENYFTYAALIAPHLTTASVAIQVKREP
jgi:predicted KAP-like P-loop ATPase